jgi:hypothetical protein
VRFKPTHIKEGRSLVRRMETNKWAMGDLLIRVFPPEQFPLNNPTFALDRTGPNLLQAVTEFASAIGGDIEAVVLCRYRATALRWPKEKRLPSCSWHAHVVLNGAKDRFSILRPGMTAEEARAAGGYATEQTNKRLGHTYEGAISKIQGAISLKKSAARTISRLSLTSEQIFFIGSLVGADADALDLIIEAADLQVEEAIA